jgi:uncharacterized OsmC-like protein
MTKAAVAKELNGVNVQNWYETIDAIRETPQIADFKFRLRNSWITGGNNLSTIKEFYGAGREDSTRQEPFVLEADEPQVLLGTDKAANPAEFLLHALTACVTTSMVYHAAARGIRIDEVESRVEGDLDLHGFLGMDENVPAGYKNIRMMFKIKADVPEEKLEEILKLGPTYSPIFDTVTRGINVQVALDR